MSQQGERDDGTPGSDITEIVTDNGTAMPILGVVDILGGTGITTSASGNVVIITATGEGFKWNVVTAASNPVSLTAENGYITKGASPVQFTLPAAASVGDVYRIVGYSNLWTIAQNATQTISLGMATTTSGGGGSLSATQVKDCLDLICVTPNTEFVVTDSVGNPTMV